MRVTRCDFCRRDIPPPVLYTITLGGPSRGSDLAVGGDVVLEMCGDCSRAVDRAISDIRKAAVADAMAQDVRETTTVRDAQTGSSPK